MITPRSAILFNRKNLLFFLFYLFSFNLISCDLINAVNDPDYFELIDEEIAWANAAKLTVTIAIPQSWGTSPQIGTNRCFDKVRTSQTPRKGYPFEVEFTPEAAYSLLGWRAYATSTLESLKIDWLVDPDILTREKVPTLKGVIIPELPARGGKGSFTVNTTVPVTLVPWCKAEPYVIRTDPRDDPSFERYYHPSAPVVIYFNAALSPDMEWKLNDGIINVKGRAVGSNDEYKDINNYFLDPVYESRAGSHAVTVKPKGTMPDLEIMMTIGPKIYNAEFEGMSKAEILYYKVVDVDKFDAHIDTWSASYSGGNIDISWTLTGADSSKAEVEVYFQENRGAMMKLDGAGNTRKIVNAGSPDYSGVQQGNGVASNIREYTIYLEFYVGGYYTGATPVKIWNIPGMSVSNTSPLIEVTSATGDSDDADGTISLDNLKLNDPNVKYVLTDDIALTDWTPIGDSTDSFQGKFYGNGHTVSISGSISKTVNFGLFGEANNAVIRDLTVSANINPLANLTTTSFGCVAGIANGTTEIRNIIIRGSVTTGVLGAFVTFPAWKYIGGIAGYMAGTASIANCYADIDLNATISNSFVSFGGIVGQIVNSSSGNCIDTVKVPGRLSVTPNTEDVNIFAGGVVGYCNAASTITNADFSGTLTVYSNSSSEGRFIGGIAGEIYYSTLTNSSARGKINIPNTFELIGANLAIGGLAGLAHNMTAMSSWASGDLSTSVRVQRDNTVLIGGIVGQCYSSTLNGCWYQDGAITASVNITNTGGNPTETLFLGGAFGRIEGNSNVAKCYSRASRVKGSVQGWATSETNADVVYVGGFVGDLDVPLTKCFATAEVEAQGFMSYAGGLVGRAGIIKDPPSTIPVLSILSCYATGDVYSKSTGTHAYSGGLLGRTNNPSGSMEHCYAQGNVYSTGPYQTFAGGLVGIMQATSSELIIQYCFARGSVSTISSNLTTHCGAGGLVGHRQDGEIKNCVALGTMVTGMAPADIFGVHRILGLSTAGSQQDNRAIDIMFLGELTSYTSNPNPVYNSVTVGDGLNTLDGLSTLPAVFKVDAWWEDWGFSTVYWNYRILSRGCPELKMD